MKAALQHVVAEHRACDWHVGTVQLQGSRTYGLDLPSSDLDLYIVVEGTDVVGRELTVLLGMAEWISDTKKEQNSLSHGTTVAFISLGLMLRL